MDYDFGPANFNKKKEKSELQPVNSCCFLNTHGVSQILFYCLIVLLGRLWSLLKAGTNFNQ